MTVAQQGVFASLREYLDEIEDRGLLKDIEGADWDLEIGALTERVAFADDPKALLFDDVEGYPGGYRVATNLYVTETLQALALGLPADQSGVELVQAWRDKSAAMDRIEPATVRDGPVRENVLTGDDIDVLAFPTPRWHEEDGGRYIGTGDAVFTRDPDEGWVNVATYRSQIHDAETVGIMTNQTHHGRIHMRKFWERGEAAPIVMTVGQAPAVYASSCLPVPWGEPELAIAGGINGAPIDVIEHDGTGLPVPANAEIAVIGHVPPPDERSELEGPFGECMGYYAGGERELPVIEVEEVWHRDDPILQGNPTMYSSAMKHALGAELVTGASIWDSIDDEVPNVRGVYSLYQQCQQGSNIVAVAIEQAYAGHAKQTAAATLGAHATGTMSSAVVVVDDDIDPADLDEVLFAFATRCDPAEDIDFVEDVPSSTLDPRVHPNRMDEEDLTTSTMLVDATIPYHWREEYPHRNVSSEALKDEVGEKWAVDDWT